VRNSYNNLIRNLLTRGTQSQSAYKRNVRQIQVRRNKHAQPFNAPHRQEFGFSSHAPDGSDLIVASLGGNRTASFVLCAFNEQYLVELEPGESRQYNQYGDFVRLRKDGIAHIKADTKVYADTPEFECTGNAKVGGRLDVVGPVTSEEEVEAAGVKLTKHPHRDVQRGSEQSGEPVAT
jgi:phage baseplate assembly protein V